MGDCDTGLLTSSALASSTSGANTTKFPIALTRAFIKRWVLVTEARIVRMPTASSSPRTANRSMMYGTQSKPAGVTKHQ
jgi:hypothetical protein